MQILQEARPITTLQARSDDSHSGPSQPPSQHQDTMPSIETASRESKPSIHLSVTLQHGETSIVFASDDLPAEATAATYTIQTKPVNLTKAVPLPFKLNFSGIPEQVIVDEIHARHGVVEPGCNTPGDCRGYLLAFDYGTVVYPKSPTRQAAFDGAHRHRRLDSLLQYAYAAAMSDTELKEAAFQKGLTTPFAANTRAANISQDRWLDYGINNLEKAHENMLLAKEDYRVKKEYVARNLGAFRGHFDGKLNQALETLSEVGE